MGLFNRRRYHDDYHYRRRRSPIGLITFMIVAYILTGGRLPSRERANSIPADQQRNLRQDQGGRANGNAPLKDSRKSAMSEIEKSFGRPASVSTKEPAPKAEPDREKGLFDDFQDATRRESSNRK